DTLFKLHISSQVLNINLRAQIVFCRAEVKVMLASKRESESQSKGVIINWASILSSVAINGDNTAYICSKHAIAGLTKSMAAAYGKQGIRTNAVAPGQVQRAFSGTLTQPF